MHAFHNALLEQASAVLPDFQKKIEQRIQQQQQSLWPSVVFWL
jgi:hypothetical protein